MAILFGYGIRVLQQLNKLSLPEILAGKNNRTRANTIAEIIHQYPAYHFFLLTSTGITKPWRKN